MGKVSIAVSGGSGSGSDECTATRAEVLKGYKTITSDSDDEVVEGTLELSGDAADSQVLSGKTYYNTNAQNKRSGTMTNNGAVSQTLNAGASYTIPSGYHNGTGKVTANSLASQTSASAAAGHILSGQTAWVNGNRITGNIASIGGQTISPGASSQTVSSSGKYMTGNVVVNAISNLSAANIKKGTVVGGVTGTFEGYVPTATDLYLRGNNITGFNLIGSSGSGRSAKFESGGIQLIKSDVVLYGGQAINYTPYNYLNVELYYESLGFTAQTRYLSMGIDFRNNTSNALLAHVNSSELSNNVSRTISISLSNISLTAVPYLRLRVEGQYYYTGDDGDYWTSIVSGSWNGWIYRVWLT